MPSFLQGLSLGIAYVAPIGMQNIFVIDSAAADRLPRALLTALIVISFDITLALACFFGIGAIMERHVWLRTAVSLAGSIAIIAIGTRLLLSRPARAGSGGDGKSILQTISAACIATWCNPQAIIDGTMLLGASHASLEPSEAVPFIIGVCSASALWFSGLAIAVSSFSSLLTEKVIRGISIACGSVICLYGLKLLATAAAAQTG